MKDPLGIKHGIRTWLEIDRSAIRSNLEEFRKNLGQNVKIAGVVKSNAYGHGLVDFSRELADLGIDWLAVDSIVEGVRLREKEITLPILVLGYTLPDNLLRAYEFGISITVSSFENLAELLALEGSGKPLPKAHLKFNTGMNRQGFREDEMRELMTALSKFERADFIEGIYTHLAAADDGSCEKQTSEQLGRFGKIIEKIKSLNINPIVHASNTPGTMNYPKAVFGMVRLGIGLYGIYPSPEAKENSSIPLRSVLSWKTIISEIHLAKAGEAVGYGFSEKLARDSRLAVCPIGYWHGYPRGLSSKGQVLVGGKRVKVLGRVSMDMIVVDITEIAEAGVGDEVVLLGRQGNQEITAEEIAEMLGTISYEIVTRINPLIKKFYINQNVDCRE
jgi:alanine racemase